ncbi:MAG: Flp pilus assembly complex ATPase component TadA [Candidatus Aenigmarchaeota archaeon]|nr:Flp pilus assembly complex ATPase component TadA [Candidatus Aenigmarchaeota archaeon]
MKSLRTLFKKKKSSQYPKIEIKEPSFLITLPSAKNVRDLDIRYPLLEPLVFANIKWDPERKVLRYNVLEPRLTKSDQEILEKVKSDILELIDVELTSLEEQGTAMEYLEKKVLAVLEEEGVRLSSKQYVKILYYIYRDFIGLNEIEPMMHDPFIEDVGCDGANSPIYVVHTKFGSLASNVVYKDMGNLNNFVVKLSERCGRYISYARPLLDGSLPDGSRVQASLAKDVTTKGPTFSIRKFRKFPFSPIELIKMGTASTDVMAYLWLVVQSGISLLICGGVSTGKTSMLNAITLFIQPEARIVSIEDSVTGEAEILVKDNGIKRMSIKDYIDKDTKKPILTLDGNYKIKFAEPSKIFKHSVDKDVYEILTSTGRTVRVTSDHSLFSWGENGMEEAKPADIEGKFIAVPRILPVDGERKAIINLLDFMDVYRDDFLAGKPVRRLLANRGYRDLKMSKSTYQWCKKRGIMRISRLRKDDIAFTKSELRQLRIKSRGMKSLPVIFHLDDAFLNFVGLWLGDGSYDNHNSNRVIISNSDRECRGIVERLARKLDLNITCMNDGVSMSVNSTIFYKFMKYVLKLDGYSRTKGIPDTIFNLSNKQLKQVLKGYFSADGTVKNYEVSCSSQSLELLKDIQTVFLRLGIISRMGDFNRKDHCVSLSVSSYDNVKKFKNDVGFLQGRKSVKLDKICLKKPKHTCSDVIPLTECQLRKVNDHHKICWPYLQGMQRIGRDYLREISEKGSIFNDISHSDILWDKVAKVKKLPKRKRMVYDISVPGFENFLCSNVILHNTRELNLPHENWIPAVSRIGFGVPEASGKRYGEVTLFELLKESFRQNPDYVIVGEVRGKEAYVMFQGMASGHASIGTMHAGSVEDVIKRLETPPIELSPSLVESLDLLLVMIRAKERGESARRIKEIVEVQSVDIDSGKAKTLKSFVWVPSRDGFDSALTESDLLRKISFEKGMNYELIKEEFENRKKVLEWMLRHDVLKYDNVAEFISLYYKDKEALLEWVSKDISPYVAKSKVKKLLGFVTGLKAVE